MTVPLLLLHFFYNAVSQFATMPFGADAAELEMTSNDQHGYTLQHVYQYNMAHLSQVVHREPSQHILGRMHHAAFLFN